MDSDLDNIQGIEFDESSNDVPNDSTDLEGSLSSLSFVSDGDSPFNGKRRRSIRPGSRREGLVPLEEEENFLGEDVYLLSNKTEEQYGDHRPWVRAKKDIRTHFKQILSSLYNHKISLSIYLLLLLSVILLFFFNKSWETLSLAGIVSILVLISESMLLVANVMPSSFVFLFGLAIFWLSGILDDSDALSGFSNPGVLLVASSSVISRVLEFTRVYKYLFTTVFLKPKGIRLSLCLLLPFMMVVSAFINESAVSGALTNTVVVWGLRSRLSIPQVLLPMLYAILLGSTLTLIGCGTNIVINQLAENDQKNPVSFGIFEQGIVGLPLCVISLSYLVFVSPFLIGSSESDDQKKKISPQVFCGKGIIMEHCPFIGQTYEVAGLEIVHTHISLIESAGGTVKYSSSESILLGTFLSESDSTHSKSPETPSSTFVGRELAHQIEESKMGHQIVEAGDILWISAPIEQLMIVFMIEGVSVASSELRHISGSRSDRKLVEAVVAQWTSLQLSHSLFRRKYDACILAIYRAGTRYFLSDTEYLELNSGDVLLLETTSQGFHSLQKRKEFGLVTLYRTASVAKKGYGVLGGAICVVLFVAVIVVSSLEYVSVSQGFLGLALLYVFLRFLPFEMAMDSIDGDVLITMAASFATANALDETGAGQVMSDSLHEIIPFGQLGIYIVVYLMGFGMTQFISNPAAASMMYSAASNLAATSHSNKKGVLYVLMFACSASFLTPIGYSANSFLANRANVGLKEFLKVGIMLALIDMVVVVGMFTYLYRPPDESTDTN